MTYILEMMRSDIAETLLADGYELDTEFNCMFIRFRHSGHDFLLDLRMKGRYMLSCEVARAAGLDVPAFKKVLDRTNSKVRGVNVCYDVEHDIAVLSLVQFFSSLEEFSSHFEDCLLHVSDNVKLLQDGIDDELLPF